MGEFLMYLNTWLGGVFGLILGVIVLGLAAAMLALPYWMMIRGPGVDDPKKRREDALSNRY